MKAIFAYTPKSYFMQESILADFVAEAPKKAKDYLILSVIAVIVYQILGVFALLYSILTIVSNRRGAFEKAQKRSRIAKVLAIISIILGIILYIMRPYVFEWARRNGYTIHV